MSREMLYRFKRGQGVHDQQLDTLGRILPDPDADGYWCYGHFFGNGTYEVGMSVRHAEHGDLTKTGSTEVTAAAPVGSVLLEATGEFGGRDVVGALGVIYDGAGAGQSFYVIKKLSVDKIQIHLLTSTDGIPANGTGWATALDTTSRFRLMLPGRFLISNEGDLTSGAHAGVVQTKVIANQDRKPYGYVKCRGDCFGRLDASGTAPAAGGLLTIGSDGLIIGGGNAETAIGRAYFAEGLTEDGLIPMYAAFPYWGTSHRKPITGNSRNAHEAGARTTKDGGSSGDGGGGGGSSGTPGGSGGSTSSGRSIATITGFSPGSASAGSSLSASGSISALSSPAVTGLQITGLSGPSWATITYNGTSWSISGTVPATPSPTTYSFQMTVRYTYVADGRTGSQGVPGTLTVT